MEQRAAFLTEYRLGARGAVRGDHVHRVTFGAGDLEFHVQPDQGTGESGQDSFRVYPALI